MRRVYFDGTYETAGHVLAACSMVDARVMVVCARRLPADARHMLHTFEDCMGRIGARGRICVGSPRRCWTCADGVEAFFDHVSAFEGDAREQELLESLLVCGAGEACRGCASCARVRRVAPEYGVYDVA